MRGNWNIFFWVEEVDTFGVALFFGFLCIFFSFCYLCFLYFGGFKHHQTLVSLKTGNDWNLNFTTSPEVRSCGTSNAWEMAISVIKVDSAVFASAQKKGGKV